MSASTPPGRVRPGNDRPVRSDGSFVLYWMIGFRRLEWNFALQRALERARELDRPIVVFEPLRAGYRWASDRLHTFALQGMTEHVARLREAGILYYPYVEPEPGAGRGLLRALGDRACLVVTDDSPAFFIPRMLEKAGQKLGVRLELVDANGLLPLGVTSRTFTTAYSFRRFLQKRLPEHLLELPDPEPLGGKLPPRPDGLPGEILERWPSAADALKGSIDTLVAELPIDHEVVPAPGRGGATPARKRLHEFVEDGLDRYGEDRNDPDRDPSSRLSPWLHWGHLSVHEVFRTVAEREGWAPGRLSDRTDGKRRGWWGMSESAEAFLDELVTWRELCYNTAATMPDYRCYESLPDWALETLAEHEADRRPWLYPLAELEGARTHDELWNAAQTELVREGRIHNYLRMLWGKKILEWSETPRAALDVMIELNNKYALDGRDPNSYGGIFWTLGRYDRGWPERAVYGKVRSMTSESTRRKLNVDRYLERYTP